MKVLLLSGSVEESVATALPAAIFSLHELADRFRAVGAAFPVVPLPATSNSEFVAGSLRLLSRKLLATAPLLGIEMPLLMILLRRRALSLALVPAEIIIAPSRFFARFWTSLVEVFLSSNGGEYEKSVFCVAL